MSLDPSANDWEHIYSPRFHAYAPPQTGIFDYTNGCRCVRVNPLWVPFINGVLDVLMEKVYWSERDDFAKDQITELQLALAGGETMGDCPPQGQITIETNLDNTCFRWLQDGIPISDWICPPQGAQGEQGVPGIPGQPGADGEDAPIPVFEWDGTILKIDVDADGTFDLEEDLQGEQGIPGQDGQDGAPGAAPEMRYDESNETIQWRLEGSPSWIDLLDVSELEGPQGQQGIPGQDGQDGAQGQQGVPGPKGDKGEPGADSMYPDLPTYEPGMTEANVCAAVTSIVNDYLIPIYNTVLDEEQYALNATHELQDNLVTLAELLTAGVVELFPADEFVKMRQYWDQARLDDQRIWINNPANQEAMKEWLYCAVITNNLQMTYQIWLDWLAWIEPQEPYGDATELYGNFARIVQFMIGFDRFRSRWYVYAQDQSSVCSGLGWCPGEWEHVFDFTINDGGWIPRIHATTSDNMATYNPGVGWQYGDTLVPSDSRRYRYCHMIRSFDISTLTYALVEGTMAYDVGGDASFKLSSIWKWSPSQLVLVSEPAPNALPTEWTGSQNMNALLIGINISSRPQAQALQGHCTITKVTLRGVGDNPFE